MTDPFTPPTAATAATGTANGRVAGIMLRHSRAVDTHCAVGRLIHSLLLLLMDWLRGIEQASPAPTPAPAPAPAPVVRAAPPPGNRPPAENPASASQPRRPPAGAGMVAAGAIAPPSLRRPLPSLRRMPGAEAPPLLVRPARSRRVFALHHKRSAQKTG